MDAFVIALKNAIKIDFEIMEYGEHALGQGADAEAVTYIQLKCEGGAIPVSLLVRILFPPP